MSFTYQRFYTLQSIKGLHSKVLRRCCIYRCIKRNIISVKKVLIIAYYFPPSGGSGVQRTLKFVKYLQEFGWEPVVLTARNADYPAIDETLFSEIPKGIKIYRSKIIEPYKLYRRLTGKADGESTDIATLTLDEAQKQKISEQIAEWVRSAFFVPDARIGWYLFASALGKKIIKREKIDIIYSSAPPYTTHLIGLKLHRYSGIPWVADFRDSWIGWLSTPQWRPKISRAIEMRMEKSVLQNADKILTVSGGVQEDLLSRHENLRDDRWQLLANGYDADDFANVKAMHRDERLTITYTGSLYGNRNPEYLVRALESIHAENPHLLQKLLIRFVGRVGEPIAKRMKSSPVHFVFKIIPYVTHAESLDYLLSGDISLLIIDDAPANRGILTGKLFEYIGAGKPILALAPEGDAAELIRSHNLGRVISPKNVAEIKNAILAFWDNPSTGTLKQGGQKEHGDKFERRYQTKELANLFDALGNN